MDNFLAFWMDDLLIYSQTEEHFKHIQLVFEKFCEVGIKLKMFKCKFFKSEIEYLGYLVSGKGIFPVKQRMKAINYLASATNITEARHMIDLIGYYREFFLYLVPYPITYQSGTSQVSQKNWSTLTKEAYVIYMSFCRMVYYLKYGQVMRRGVHAPLSKFICSVMKNNKVNNWSQEICLITPYIEFEHIKGKENVLVDSVLR